MSFLNRTCLVLGGIAMLAGCSSSSGGGEADSGTDVDGGADSGGGGQVFIVSVLNATDDSPINGASVALDLGGQRFEATTNSSGVVDFRDLTFGEDTATVTVYRNLFGVVSYVGLGPSEDVLQVRLPRRDPASAGAASVTGTAYDTGVPITNPLLVTSTAGVASSSAMPPAFEVPVASGEAGSLVALEYEVLSPGGRGLHFNHLRWAVKAHPATNDTTMVDIDFSTDEVAPTTVMGALVLPTRVDSPLRTDSVGQITVTTDNPATLLGVIDTSTLATDQFDLVGRYVTVPGTFEPQTTFTLRVPGPAGVAHELSTVTQFAYPTNNFTIDTFMDAPEVTSGLDLVPIEDEITWTAFEPVARAWVRVMTEDDEPERVWDVFVPEGATSVTFPELPTGASSGSVLGGLPLAGRVFLCDVDETRNLCARLASSRKIELIP